jgi:hypothetical protein
MVKASILGPMVGGIKDNGKIICFMVMVYTLGPTVGNMKDTIKTIKKMARVFIHGLMEKVIMVDGRIVNNTEKPSLQTQKDKVKQVFGKTEIE